MTKIIVDIKNYQNGETREKQESTARVQQNSPEETLLSDLRARQKLLDPNKFSKQKVTVK